MDMSLSYCCFAATNELLINPKLALLRSSTVSLSARIIRKPLRCMPLEEQVDGGILCEPCKGRGWLLCDFCKGQKTNVKAENKKIYRRCPSCRAVGYMLCSKCKVFKCVTFPNYTDGEDLTYGS
ncbi:hypothetical protein ACET3Z_000163 [Daucus carota]